MNSNVPLSSSTAHLRAASAICVGPMNAGGLIRDGCAAGAVQRAQDFHGLRGRISKRQHCGKELLAYEREHHGDPPQRCAFARLTSSRP